MFSFLWCRCAMACAVAATASCSSSISDSSASIIGVGSIGVRSSWGNGRLKLIAAAQQLEQWDGFVPTELSPGSSLLQRKRRIRRTARKGEGGGFEGAAAEASVARTKGSDSEQPRSALIGQRQDVEAASLERGSPANVATTSKLLLRWRGGGGLLSKGSASDGPFAVMLYLPNLIGYVRIGLLAGAVLYAKDNWKLASGLYLASFCMDYTDGLAARALDQTSRLGVVLDMVTDRCSTAALLTVLAGLYPHFAPFFISMMVLDTASHWFHMYRSASAPLQGRGKTRHHKDMGDTSLNPILRAYYIHKPLFGWSILSAELLYCFLYVQAHLGHSELLGWLVLSCVPGWFFKQVTNVAQLCSSVVALSANGMAS